MFSKNEKGKVLAKVKQNAPKIWHTGNQYCRSTFHEILTEEVIKQGINIHYKKSLERIVEDEWGVTAIFEDGAEAYGDSLFWSGCGFV